MLLPRPMTVPGFSTEPHPTSTSSPTMAPTFLRLVAISSVPSRTTTSCLSLLTLEVMAPAPMWAL